MPVTLKQALELIRTRLEGSAENRTELQQIDENSIITGLYELFKESNINNILEYFKGYRSVYALGDIPILDIYSNIYMILNSTITKDTSTTEDIHKIDQGIFNYKREYKLVGHLSKVLCMVYDRSESIIYTGGEDGLIKAWDSTLGRVLGSLRGHSLPIFGITINYSNTVLVSCDQGGHIVFWSIKGKEFGSILGRVETGESIDYLEYIYQTKEPLPLEYKKGKGKGKTKENIQREESVLAISNTGKIFKAMLEKESLKLENILDPIEDDSFNEACSSRGKRITVLAGAWPFAILLDTEDPSNRFYILDTEGLLTSAVDTSSNALRIAVSTYTAVIFIWTYHPNEKPSKSNIQVRKTFKGRELEGAWIRETIDIKEMQETIYINSISFLKQDTILITVDTESNIRIINTENSKTIVIPKEFKVCTVEPHPILPLFLVVEINGDVKVYNSEGRLISLISTGISIGGTVTIDSLWSSIYLTDSEGGVHKYSLYPRQESNPRSEFFIEDFLFFRDRIVDAIGERVHIENTIRMNGIIDVCRKNTRSTDGICTYTLQGEPNRTHDMSSVYTIFSRNTHSVLTYGEDTNTQRTEEISNNESIPLLDESQSISETEEYSSTNIQIDTKVTSVDRTNSKEDTDEYSNDDTSIDRIDIHPLTYRNREVTDKNRKLPSVTEIDTVNNTNKTYTLQVPEKEVYPEQHLPSYKVVIERKTRSEEIAAIVQLQLDMIDNQIFEKEYKSFPTQQSNIVIPDEDEEENTSIEISSSTEEEFSADNTNTSSQTEDLSASNTASRSTRESEDKDSDVISLTETEETPSEMYSDLSERQAPRPKRKRASSVRKNTTRQAAIRAQTLTHPQEIDFSLQDWYTATSPRYPLLPQIKDKLVLIPGRLQNSCSIISPDIPANSPPMHLTVTSLSPEPTHLSITCRINNRVHKIEYHPTLYSNDPFVIEDHYNKLSSVEYTPTEDIYFYLDGTLTKGSYLKPKRRSSSLLVQSNTATYTVEPYDIQYSPSDYSVDLSYFLSVLAENKPGNSIFYTKVSSTEYPDYYSLIPVPINLGTVSKRIKNKYYRSKQSLITDLDTILKNCQLYNEPDSEISNACQRIIDQLLINIK
ncbi:hypothetical protein NEOKW01_1597 [Nematocida sp. AWRm80]|nr:hypothetical protein NEOKW01_1597 [Nematocida sp. AWRm80]